MKSTFLQIGKQQELSELFQNLPYGCDVAVSVMISVDEDVVQIHNDKDINFLS